MVIATIIILSAQSHAQRVAWPDSISANAYQECHGGYGSFVARVKIDLRARTYETMQSPCRMNITGFERGTIEVWATSLRKTATAFGTLFPGDSGITWQPTHQQFAGSFAYGPNPDELVEFDEASGTRKITYHVSNPNRPAAPPSRFGP
jgi:hypothetical protein